MLSYERLLEVFWKEHDPTASPWSRQYANIVFYHNDAQRKAAEASRAQVAQKIGKQVRTGVLPYTGFTLAEDYHQKFSLQRFPELLAELGPAYPTMRELVDSTAAARLNGYAGGGGSCEALQAELDSLGLSQAGRERIWKLACTNKGSSLSCPLPKRR